MADPAPTAHVCEDEGAIAFESPNIGIRIEGPADTEEMSIDGLSADGSHAWCAKVLKSPLQLQVEGGISPVNWSLPFRFRSPDSGFGSLSSPSLSQPPSPLASSPGSCTSGYDFPPATPPDAYRHPLDPSSEVCLGLDFQDLQDYVSRREELLPFLQDSPDLLSLPESPSFGLLCDTFSAEERVCLSKSVLDHSSPSALYPSSSSPSIPVSGCLSSSPIFAFTAGADHGRQNSVLNPEIPPLSRNAIENDQRSPSPSPSLLLNPDLAPNSTEAASMDDNRVSDRSLSVHRHTNSMSTSSTPGPHGPHGSVLSHYHSPDNRAQSPSFARRSLARHARIRSRSASPYEASSETHNHPRRSSSSRSISDLHAQSSEAPPLTQIKHHRPSSGNGAISRSPQSSSTLATRYRLRAASFDSPEKKTGPPTSVERGSYHPEDESGDDVEMDSTPFIGAESSRRRSASLSSTSSSNSLPSPPPHSSSTRHYAGGHKPQSSSRSYYDRDPMAVESKGDEAAPDTDDDASGSEDDGDYRGSRPSSYTARSPVSRQYTSNRASSYSNPSPRRHSHSPSRPAGPSDNTHRYTYRITAVAPSDVSASPIPSSSSRKVRRLSHSPVRYPDSYSGKIEDFPDDDLPHKRASPPRNMDAVLSRYSAKSGYRDFETDEDEGSEFDDDDDDDYRDSLGRSRGGRVPVHRAAIARRGSNAHLATKPIYGSPLKGSILPTDAYSDAERFPAAKPRSTATRGRPRSGSGALPYPSPRASVASSSVHDSDGSSSKRYRDVGSKNIDLASEKRRKGEKRFQCCYKDCKKMFTTNQNRQIHQWKHTGEKPYRCKCGYGSASRSDLRRHLSRKKTVNPVCDEIPVDKAYLNSLVAEFDSFAEADDDE